MRRRTAHQYIKKKKKGEEPQVQNSSRVRGPVARPEKRYKLSVFLRKQSRTRSLDQLGVRSQGEEMSNFSSMLV